MNSEQQLSLLTDNIVKTINDVLEYLGTVEDDVITNSDIFLEIPNNILGVKPINESETFDPLTGILDLTDYLENWKQDIIDEFNKNNMEYTTFIRDREALFNDILLKCIAAEKTADMSPDDMDSILELRVKLLKRELISDDIIDYDTNFFNMQDSNIINLVKDVDSIKTKNLDTLTKFKDIINILNKTNYKITNEIIEYIQNSIDYMELNKNNIIKIDEKMAEIVKVVTVSSIMVSASDKKREIMINNYNSASIEYLTSGTFMEIHKNRTDQELGRSMKETVKEISIKKEYSKFFNDLLKYYKNI